MSEEIAEIAGNTSWKKYWSCQSDGDYRSMTLYAQYGISKFTYLGRNTCFLQLLGKSLPSPVNSVALLGSGPIEPFEVATLAPYKRAKVYAFDIDPLICTSIEQCALTGEIDLSSLRHICRAENEPNELLADVNKVRSTLAKHPGRGMLLADRLGESAVALRVLDAKTCERVEAKRIDLRKAIPEYVAQCNLIFEGCMLVNWFKTEADAPCVAQFLTRVQTLLQRDSLFASIGSYGQFREAADKSVLDEAVSAKLVPVGGLLTRWNVRQSGDVTSQFGLAFSNSCCAQFNTGRWMRAAITACKAAKTKYKLTILELSGLRRLVRQNVVLAFQNIDQDRYRVLYVDSCDLSLNCQRLGVSFEVRAD